MLPLLSLCSYIVLHTVPIYCILNIHYYYTVFWFWIFFSMDLALHKLLFVRTHTFIIHPCVSLFRNELTYGFFFLFLPLSLINLSEHASHAAQWKKGPLASSIEHTTVSMCAWEIPSFSTLYRSNLGHHQHRCCCNCVFSVVAMGPSSKKRDPTPEYLIQYKKEERTTQQEKKCTKSQLPRPHTKWKKNVGPVGKKKK